MYVLGMIDLNKRYVIKMVPRNYSNKNNIIQLNIKKPLKSLSGFFNSLFQYKAHNLIARKHTPAFPPLPVAIQIY